MKNGALSKYDVSQRGVSNMCDVINKQPIVYFHIKPVDDCPVEQPQHRAALQTVLQLQWSYNCCSTHIVSENVKRVVGNVFYWMDLDQVLFWKRPPDIHQSTPLYQKATVPRLQKNDWFWEAFIVDSFGKGPLSRKHMLLKIR